MGHTFAILIGCYILYKFLGCCQKSLESCSNSLQSLSKDFDYQQQNSKSNLVIDLKFDDVLKDVEVNGGTVTRIDREGENTVVHINWKL